MIRTVTTKESNRLLLLLAAFLPTVPDRRFNYRSWVGSDWRGNPDLSCGTAACAGGWATTLPEFQALGLQLEKSDPEDETSAGGILMAQEADGSKRYGMEAIRYVLGLNFNEAHHLFVPVAGEENATPSEVAKKIEKFVASRS